MNSKQRKILYAIFSDPVPAIQSWSDIEKLLIAVGCAVDEGKGSRVRFVFNGEVETFHLPHPDKDAKRYQVRAARDFFTRIGVRP